MRDDQADWLAAARAQIRRVEAMPLPPNIGALLDAAAAEAPDTTALHFIASGSTLTYARLRREVHALACGLARIGIGRGTRVAVMLPNVPEFPITWLALARLGAVMVPVNLRYTAHELRYVLEDSGARHLVLHPDCLAVLDALPEPTPRLDAVIVTGEARPGEIAWTSLLDDTAELGGPAPGLDDLMNIQYTSGTTGLPKGCLQTQRYWLTCAMSYAHFDGLRYRRILSQNPFFYMTPQWLMLMAFFHRATLYVASHVSLTHFSAWLRDYRIECCYFPMDVMVRNPPAATDRDNAIIRANLAIHRADLHAALERRYGFPARGAFGMTEIGLGLFVPIGGAGLTGSGSCGMAAPFREARIADMEGNTLPTGSPGELLFRGPGLLLGYHNKPEATRAAFHGDWFRTGDLATMDARGFVTIVGRIKEMVRRAGENISATEVENALLSLPGIAEAAVVPVPDTQRGEEVKAVIVLEPGMTAADLPPERVLAHCAERLAVFKVPRFLMYRDRPLPRSTSGKPQKPALIAESDDPRAGCWDRVEARWL
jgi:crotonobetaine/carnitine-CoA ligase